MEPLKEYEEGFSIHLSLSKYTDHLEPILEILGINVCAWSMDRVRKGDEDKNLGRVTMGERG